MIRITFAGLFLLALTSSADLLSDLEFIDVQLGQKIYMGPVEPARVRGFEVLYATPGSGDVSEIAGHLLLRIMLDNNPDADALAIENPNDLVISFLADTEAGKRKRQRETVVAARDCHHRNWFNLVENRGDEESPIRSIWQSLKGLSGGFRMTMDRQTLGQALKSYTIEQDRDLLRYRLLLTEEQKTNLLAHLLWVRDNYQPRYYFFSQNCGSVLIQVTGEGIGNKTLADYDHWVTPPHTLLGNMVREGLAVRVTPAFYSYRKRGFIAREIFRDEYSALSGQYPEIQFPPVGDFFHRKEVVRARALASLGDIAMQNPALRPDMYHLAVLAQETEMIFSHKDWICEDYTSDATAEARRLQKNILFMTDDVTVLTYNALDQIQQAYIPVELEEVSQGTPHTGSYPVNMGAGFYREDSSGAEGVLTLQAGFLIQEMGSPSSVAMQRQGAIELGVFRAVAGSHGLKEWNMTGLRLAKFRDTLEGVPSVFTSSRGIGLGLTVLDVEYRKSTHQTQSTIAGLSLLGNVMSSAYYNHFLFFTVGADWVMLDEESEHNLSLRLPVGAESLISVGKKRDWQWRNTARYYFATSQENRDQLDLSSRLNCRLGTWRDSEFWIGFAVEYEKEYAAGAKDDEWDRLLGSCQVEILLW